MPKPTMLKALRVREVSGVDRPASVGASVLLWKRDEISPPDTPEIPASDGVDAKEAALSAASSVSDAVDSGKHKDLSMTTELTVAQLQAQLADVQAKLAEEQGKTTAATEAVETAKNEAKAIAKAEGDRVAALEKRLGETEGTLAQAVEKAERLDFAKRAETEFPNLPGTAEEKGDQLRAIHKMADGPAKDGLLKSLKSADAAMGAQFKELGKRGEPAADTATGEVKKRAADIRKSDPKLTEGQAMSQVMKSDPALATRYDEEVRHGQ